MLLIISCQFEHRDGLYHAELRPNIAWKWNINIINKIKLLTRNTAYKKNHKESKWLIFRNLTIAEQKNKSQDTFSCCQISAMTSKFNAVELLCVYFLWYFHFIVDSCCRFLATRKELLVNYLFMEQHKGDAKQKLSEESNLELNIKHSKRKWQLENRKFG